MRAFSGEMLLQHDPLACAVALGWNGVEKRTVPLVLEVRDGWLHERVTSTPAPTTAPQFARSLPLMESQHRGRRPCGR